MAEQLQLDSEVALDARGAAWFGGEALLALADVHLGYAWVQRQRGHLLPLSAFDDLAMQLAELLADYRPLRTVVLGDLVHAGLDLPPLEHALKTLVADVACYGQLVVVAGNHDRGLDALRQRWGLNFEVRPSLAVGNRLFVQGDPASADQALAWLANAGPGAQVVFGHEHPTVTLSDGVASKARCRCFLVAPDRLLLPAYSPWAAGSDVREGRFLSPLAQSAPWTRVVAIMGQRLLSLPWNRVLA